MTFPSLNPNSRIFSPGEYLNTTFGTWSLRENRVLHNNVMVQSQLRLAFVALTEVQMYSVLTHYRTVQGSFGVFQLPDSVWSGGSSPSNYTLTKYSWRYGEPPVVEDQLNGTYAVDVLLVSAAPTISRASGIITSVGLSLAPGEYVEPEPRNFPVQFTLSDPSITITQSDPIFKAVAYSGSSSSISITGLGFQPGMVWIKRRTGAFEHHYLFTALRGADKYWLPSLQNAETTGSNWFTSFDADGFTLPANNAAVSASAGTYVAWCWPDTGSAVSNTDGTITTSVAADAALGLSIFTYTGNGTTGATVGHGLGSTPELVIVKRLDASANSRVGGSILGDNKYMDTQSTIASTSSTTNFRAFTSTTIQLGNNSAVNASSGSYVGYAFISVTGKSKIGSYAGLGATAVDVNDPEFTPKYVLLKQTNVLNSWWHIDASRGATQRLLHTTAVEDVISTFSFRPNGFRIAAGSTMNVDGGTYIYMAFA